MVALSPEDPIANNSNTRRDDHGYTGAYNAWPALSFESLAKLGAGTPEGLSDAMKFLVSTAPVTRNGPCKSKEMRRPTFRVPVSNRWPVVGRRRPGRLGGPGHTGHVQGYRAVGHTLHCQQWRGICRGHPADGLRVSGQRSWSDRWSSALAAQGSERHQCHAGERAAAQRDDGKDLLDR